MTFIENLFKYGISKREESTITIAITINGSKLSFFCQNTIFENKTGEKSTGIGIANTRKRLEHLYPGKYTLEIENTGNLFTIRLGLDLE